MSCSRTRSLSRVLLGLAAVALTPLALAHQRSIVEPLPDRVAVGGVSQGPSLRMWKIDCTQASVNVDDATFQQAIDASRALLAANAAAGLLPQPVPSTSQLTNFDLHFTVIGAPVGAAAAVAQVEAYYEARLGSVHATGPIEITLQWGALAPGVAMSTGLALAPISWTAARTNLTTWDDADDVLPAFLPPGSTVPVRFDWLSPTVTNAPDVLISYPMLQATWPSVSGLTTPHATITVNPGITWDYDPTNGVAGALCFRTALAHEIGHALGFTSDVDVASGIPAVFDVLRFRRSTDNPPAWNYLDFQTHARLVDNNAPDDDHELDLVAFEYPMSDGAPYQGSHFREQSPRVGLMDPVLDFGETAYPEYLAPSDLRVLDVLGYDYDDPYLKGLALPTSFVPLDENPSSALTNRFRIQYDRRVGPVSTNDFSATPFFSPTVTSVVPDVSSSLWFDGTDYVDFNGFPEMTNRGTLGWTVEFWYRGQVVTLPAFQRTMFSMGTATNNRGIQVYLDANNHLILAWGSGPGNFLDLGLDPNNNLWHHVALRAFVGLGGGIFVYLDGVNVGAAFPLLQLLGGSCYAGRSHATAATSAFIGNLDSLRFYSTTLTDTEIASRRRLALPASTTGLIADYPFDALGNFGFGGAALETPNEALGGAPAAEVGGLSVPLVEPGVTDGATSFVITVTHAPISGTFFCQNDDDDSLVELQSGAPIGGPGNQGILSAPYTLNHVPGYAFCEGTACPCSNNATLGTWVGCLSSIGVGGRLRASGSQSIANANLTLVGTNMPNSTALYIAGSVTQPRTPLGDGVFCLGGTIVRLGSKTNAAGGSQFPDVGQASIAARLGATAGQTTAFQIWYRNAAVFCESATFNTSNAWSVTWTP